ncbi:MAG: DMT family transporter [Thermodesulfobacteriota bacterium]|nr:DMT family transporter [Thermodesulfobacteriota bacterium]
MQTSLYVLLALLMGVVFSIYLPMNSSVSRYLGSVITANITFFLLALVTSILIFAISGNFGAICKIKNVPPYLFLTGVVSAFAVLGITFLIPKLGARKFFILTITGQIIAAIIISHLGVLESPKDPITLKKILGAVLLMIGAIVSTV